MDIQKRLNDAKREVERLKYRPITEFSEDEPKNEAIQKSKLRLSQLEKEYKLSILGKFRASGVMKSLSDLIGEKIDSSNLMVVGKSLFIFFDKLFGCLGRDVDDAVKNFPKDITRVTYQDFSRLLSEMTEISSNAKRLSGLSVILSFVSIYFEFLSMKEIDDPELINILGFIIGEVLKTRVEIATDILLDCLGITSKQDVPFCQVFGIASIRTPDYLEKRGNQAIVMETNFSSRNVKGVYSKGMRYDQSKYYEEMYYLKTRYDYQIIYLPIIFYHEMSKYNWMSNINKFVESQADFDCELNLKNFFRAVNDSFVIFNNSKPARKKFAEQLTIFLKLSDILGDQIYPRGKMMNKCFNFINDPKNVYDIVDSSYGIKKVVEYNRIHIERFLRSVDSIIFVDLLDYIFSGFRKNRDVLKLKKLAFLFGKKVKEIQHHDSMPLTNHSTSGLEKIREFIFKDVGILSFGKNSRRERIQFLINFEELNNIYFALIEDSVDSTYSKDTSDDLKTWQPPLFRYVTIIEKSLDKNLDRKEEILMIKSSDLNQDEFFNKRFEEIDDFSESKIEKIMDIEDIAEYVEMNEEDLRKIFIEMGDLPNVPINVSNPTCFVKLLMMCDNSIGSKNQMTLEHLSNYVRISYDEGLKRSRRKIADQTRALIEKLESLGEIFFVDITGKNVYYSSAVEEKFFYLDNERVYVKNAENLSDLIQPLMQRAEEGIEDFQKFKFDTLEKNYLEPVGDLVEFDQTKQKMISLIKSKSNILTKRTVTGPFSGMLKNLPESTLSKSEPFFIDTCKWEEGLDMKKMIIIDYRGLSPREKINDLRRQSEEEGMVKLQGMKFFKTHLEIKGVKLSYESDKVHRIMKEMTKLKKDAKLHESVVKVIRHCQKKKLKNREGERGMKIYRPSENEIIKLEQTYHEMSKEKESKEINSFSLASKDIYRFSDNLSVELLKEFEDLLNSNPNVKSLYRLSKMYDSISFECSKWKVHKNEIIYSDESLVNMSYMILESDKITNDMTKVRYIIFINSEKKNECSIFKNDVKDTNIHFTNVHEEDIEQIRYRANLFSNIFTLVFYQWKKRIFSDRHLIKSFIEIYTQMFSFGTATKNIFSIYKYLNIINFSDYSNPVNLFKKYFMKDCHSRSIDYLFMRKILTNFNWNLKRVKLLCGSEDLERIRNKQLEITDLKGMFGRVDNIKDLIESNTFYNLVEKKTTNSFHSNSKFIGTIKSNNAFLEDCVEEGLSIDEVTSEDLEFEKTSFFCKESIYYGIRLIFQDIFSKDHKIDSSDRVLFNEFERTKKRKILDKQFFSETMTKRTFERFSSTFLSSRKSLKVRFEEGKSLKTVKQRMIDSTLEYLNEVYGTREMMSPVDLFEKTLSLVEKNGKLRGTDFQKLSRISALAKKEQHEGDREIYVLFIVTKILTVYIQTFFYCINMLIKGEMVVKPTISKFSLIKEITSDIFQMDSRTEIIFMNGDMASWSGRDIYSKFYFICDSMNDLGVVDSTVLNNVKFCFLMTSKMKIIVPDNQAEKTQEVDPFFSKPCLTQSFSWAQGIYHNPSSFAHACEQRLKTEIMKTYITNKFSHKYLDHSDDKNEIVNLKLEDYEDYVRISNYSPMFFSLKPSQTKDSFSRIVSEMVGVQNIKGRIFDNPVKNMRNITSSVKSPFFIVNYKSALSAISGFYDKSCDVIMSNVLNMLSYSYLAKSFGMDISEQANLPLDFGGYLQVDFDMYNRYGSQADIIDKFPKLKRIGVSLNLMYSLIDLELKFKMDENMKRLNRSLSKYRKIDKMKFDVQAEKEEFVNNIFRSKISERIEMFRKRDTLTDVLNLRSQASNKLFLNFQNEVLKLSQSSTHLFLKAFEIEKNETLDNALIADENLLTSFEVYSRRQKSLNDFHACSDIREMNNFSMVNKKISLGVKFIDFSTFDDICNGRLKRVMRSFSNRDKIHDIIDDFESIRKHFNIQNIKDYDDKKKLIKNLLEDFKMKNLVQFRPINDEIEEFSDFYLDFKFEKNRDDILKDLLSNFRMPVLPEKKKRNNVMDFINSLKSYINECLVRDHLIDELIVSNLLSESKIKLSDVLSSTKDKYLKMLMTYCSKRSLTGLSDVKVNSEFSKKSKYKIRTIYRDDSNEFKMMIVSDMNNNLKDIIVTLAETYAYFFVNEVNDENKKLISRLFHTSKLKLIDKDGDNSFFMKVEIAELEGIIFDSKNRSLNVTSTKEDMSVKRSGNVLIKKNLNSDDYYSEAPSLYTEVPNFKKMVFDVTTLRTDITGGKLISKEDFNEFDLNTIDTYSPRIRLSTKFIKSFNSSIRISCNYFVTTCSIMSYHNHDENDIVCCLKNKIFLMRPSDRSEESPLGLTISDSVIRSSLSYASDESGMDVDYDILMNYSFKKEKFRKKGRIIGGEIIVCNGLDEFNLMNLNYKVPERSNELIDSLNLIVSILKWMMNSKKVSPNNLKENINFYRTARTIVENDDRFERNIDLSQGIMNAEDTISVAAKILKDNPDFTFVDEIPKSSQILTYEKIDVLTRLCKYLSNIFDFSDDKRYHTSYMRYRNLVIDESSENVEMEIEKRMNDKKLTLMELNQQVNKIEKEISSYVHVNVINDHLESERKKIKKEVDSNSLSDIIGLKSRIEFLETENKLLKEQKDKDDIEIQELKKINDGLSNQIDLIETARKKNDNADQSVETELDTTKLIDYNSDSSLVVRNFGFRYIDSNKKDLMRNLKKKHLKKNFRIRQEQLKKKKEEDEAKDKEAEKLKTESERKINELLEIYSENKMLPSVFSKDKKIRNKPEENIEEIRDYWYNKRKDMTDKSLIIIKNYKVVKNFCDNVEDFNVNLRSPHAKSKLMTFFFITQLMDVMSEWSKDNNVTYEGMNAEETKFFQSSLPNLMGNLKKIASLKSPREMRNDRFLKDIKEGMLEAKKDEIIKIFENIDAHIVRLKNTSLTLYSIIKGILTQQRRASIHVIQGIQKKESVDEKDLADLDRIKVVADTEFFMTIFESLSDIAENMMIDAIETLRLI